MFLSQQWDLNHFGYGHGWLGNLPFSLPHGSLALCRGIVLFCSDSLLKNIYFHKGEARPVKGQWVYGKSVHLPLNFAVNPNCFKK